MIDSTDDAPSRETPSPKKRWTARLWRLLRSVLTIYLAVAVFAYFFADRLIFAPPEPRYEEATLTGSFAVTTTTGERIVGAYYPVRDAPFTILFSHGNAEDLASSKWILFDYRRLGYSAMAYDYPGYGASQGTPTTEGACRAIDAVYEHLVKDLDIPPDRIILHGRSVGGGPTLHLAAERPVGGVILESTFVSAFRVVTGIPLFPFDRFDNIGNISRCKAPLLILHGTDDELIAPWHSDRLFEVATTTNKRIKRIAGAGHNDLQHIAGRDYLEGIQRFLDGIAHE